MTEHPDRGGRYERKKGGKARRVDGTEPHVRGTPQPGSRQVAASKPSGSASAVDTARLSEPQSGAASAIPDRSPGRAAQARPREGGEAVSPKAKGPDGPAGD